MTNPFLAEFLLPKLLEYMAKILVSCDDKKIPMKKRLQARESLREARDVLKENLATMNSSKDADLWRSQAGLKVQIRGTRQEGLILREEVLNEPKMVLVAHAEAVATCHAYYPEELAIVVPVGFLN